MAALGTGNAVLPIVNVDLERGIVTMILIAVRASSVELITAESSIPSPIPWQIVALRIQLQQRQPPQPQPQLQSVRLLNFIMFFYYFHWSSRVSQNSTLHNNLQARKWYVL